LFCIKSTPTILYLAFTSGNSLLIDFADVASVEELDEVEIFGKDSVMLGTFCTVCMGAAGTEFVMLGFPGKELHGSVITELFTAPKGAAMPGTDVFKLGISLAMTVCAAVAVFVVLEFSPNAFQS
jgi:hypothetical protein